MLRGYKDALSCLQVNKFNSLVGTFLNAIIQRGRVKPWPVGKHALVQIDTMREAGDQFNRPPRTESRCMLLAVL